MTYNVFGGTLNLGLLNLNFSWYNTCIWPVCYFGTWDSVDQ